MRRRALQAGLALAIAAMPAHSQTPDCGGWNTPEFFQIATGSDVERCLAQGYGATARDEDGWTPLHWAALYGDGDDAAIGALLDAGAKVNARDVEGQTPLHLAARHDNAAAIGRLIKAGAQVDARAEKDWTPLHMAVISGNAAAIEALLDAGADPKARDAGRLRRVRLY